MYTRSRQFENTVQINMMYHNIKNKIVKNKFTKQWKNLTTFLNITLILWVYFRFKVIFNVHILFIERNISSLCFWKDP